MRFAKSFGSQANSAVGGFASRVDGQTGEVAHRVAGVITVAVRVLRVPTAILQAVPVPFIAATLALGLVADGGVRIVVLVAGAVMAAVSGAFWARRRAILRAVEEPNKLATELGIAISLSDKVDETRGALERVAGGGGWRLFDRLKGAWGGMSMTGRWIDGIGDLPRARYFVPPRIGTTVTITIAALWLVPISVVVALFALIGTIAGSL
ncbi:hypothetical protein [Aeromicrobium ginsengisoli]|uniref:Uncharacterized protein n=1 Tax=Aeromicrobium ginsengisoli TaxID=363867 RepID=A0A5M4FAP7_9ACTN|nr:hypothetical protein [Aeromicrobium ginsengisoli]KAA1395329.1 hypothetical protein ESP70_014285 [Aeromicrobium ginsengisoli]